jgi:TRAP-type transport system small permease protein
MTTFDETVSHGGGPQPPRGSIAHVVRFVAWICRTIVVLALLLIFLFTVGQVADRYVLGTNFDAYDQISRLGLVWLTFVGFAVGVWERVNIRIELLDRFLTAGVQHAITLVLDIGMAGVAILVLVEGWRLLEIGAYQAIMGTPFTYEIVYAGLLVGMGVLIFFLAVRLLEAVRGARLDPEAEGPRHDHR